MSRLFRPRLVVAIVVLTLTWCGLWRDLSVANILVGGAIAVVVTASGVGTGYRGGIRLIPLVKLVWLVAVDLGKSTVNVAVEILTPTDRTNEAIVAVQVPPESNQHLLFLIVAITLTPGTAVVDADPDTSTLYLHLLHYERQAETVAHVNDLVRLACVALPTRETGVPT